MVRRASSQQSRPPPLTRLLPEVSNRCILYRHCRRGDDGCRSCRSCRSCWSCWSCWSAECRPGRPRSQRPPGVGSSARRFSTRLKAFLSCWLYVTTSYKQAAGERFGQQPGSRAAISRSGIAVRHFWRAICGSASAHHAGRRMHDPTYSTVASATSTRARGTDREAQRPDSA